MVRKHPPAQWFPIALAVLAALAAQAAAPDPVCRVISISATALELEISTARLEAVPVRTEQGIFTRLALPGGYTTHRVGSPALPTVHSLLEIPAGSTPRVTVTETVIEEKTPAELGSAAPVVPRQPSYSKRAKPSEIYFRHDAAAYAVDAFTDLPLAEANVSGTMRGRGVARLVVRPVRYNPVAGRLRIARTVRLRIDFDTPLKTADDIAAKSYSPFFESAFSMFLNHDTGDQHTKWAGYSDLTVYPVTYLIVAGDQLQGNAKLAEFIAWKTQKGFRVIDTYVTAGTSPAEIDAWVETQYATLTPKPSFLLLVGDESGTYRVQTEVDPPLGANGGVTRSDLLYGVIGTLAGANRIPSIYVGRFSVRSLAELNAQVDKTIWYEKGQFLSPGFDTSYLAAPLGAAGVDALFGAPYGNPQIAYGWNHYFNAANGMPGAVSYYHPDSGTRAGDIISGVSAGVNFYNYTAHGYVGGFANPAFNIANVNALTNANRYPLVIGNCCLTGSFGENECFGEAWLNVADKGGVGFIGASMNTLWNEDLVMGVGTIAAYDDPDPPLSVKKPGMYDGIMMGTYPTQAAMKHVGLLAVENYGSGYVDSYWSAYHLFGDPSLMVFFGIPTPQTVAHAPIVSPNAATFAVTTTPGAYVALSDDAGLLHGATVADGSGLASVTITPFVAGMARLTITAQFREPYFADIFVAEENAAYLLVADHVAHSNAYGRRCLLDVAFTNVGAAVSEDVVVSATVTNPYATLVDASEDYGTIGPGTGVWRNAAFSFDVAADVPDQTVIRVDLLATDSYSKRVYSNHVDVTVAGHIPAPPACVLDPGSFHVVLAPSQTCSRALSVSNAGEVALSYKAGVPTLPNADFNLSLPDDWTIVNGGDSPHTWERVTSYFDNTLDGTPFMFVDSDGADFALVDEELITPAVPANGLTSLWLDFDHFLHIFSGDESGNVDVWDGSQWTHIWSNNVTCGSWDTPEHLRLDLLPYVNPNLRVRFHYADASYDWYWAIDNVVISGTGPGLGWLALNGGTTASGSVAGNAHEWVHLTFETADRPEGEYTTLVSFSHNGAGSPANVPVAMTVHTPLVSNVVDLANVVSGENGIDVSWETKAAETSYYVYCANSMTNPFVCEAVITSNTWTYNGTNEQLFFWIEAVTGDVSKAAAAR